MRLDIRYRMVFEYDEPVREAHNEIRIRPRDGAEQRLLGYRLTPNPASRVLSFVDYWGTTVEHVGIVPAHRRFEITTDTAVETRSVEPLPDAALVEVYDEPFRLDNAEFLTPSSHVQWNENIADIAKSAVAGHDGVLGATRAIVDATRSILRYERGATSIGVDLAELLGGGAGVCQDFTHLTIGMMRVVGIPARYVSGYLFAADETDGDDGDESEPVIVQTHAWVEAAIPGQGWHPVDPTNDRAVGERHVVIGHGRDYDDVPPVRGVYVGEGRPTVEASVEMRRMEAADRTSSPSLRSRSPVLLSTVVRPDPAAVASQQQQ